MDLPSGNNVKQVSRVRGALSGDPSARQDPRSCSLCAVSGRAYPIAPLPFPNSRANLAEVFILKILYTALLLAGKLV